MTFLHVWQADGLHLPCLNPPAPCCRFFIEVQLASSSGKGGFPETGWAAGDELKQTEQTQRERELMSKGNNRRNHTKPLISAAFALCATLCAPASQAGFTFENNVDDIAGAAARYDVLISHPPVGLVIPGFKLAGILAGEEATGAVRGLSAHNVQSDVNYRVTLIAKGSTMGEVITSGSAQYKGLGLFSKDQTSDVRAVIRHIELRDPYGALLRVTAAAAAGCQVSKTGRISFLDRITTCAFEVTGEKLARIKSLPGQARYTVRAADNAKPGGQYSNVLEYRIEQVST